MPVITYGLMLESERKHDSNYVRAVVMAREDESAHPINPTDSSTGAKEDRSRADLQLYGFVSDYDGKFIRHDVCYYNPHTVDYYRAALMSQMLAKIERAIERSEAREHGDVFAAFAAAVGAKWVVTRRSTNTHRTYYSDSEWEWTSVALGRDKFRKLIADAEADQVARGVKYA